MQVMQEPEQGQELPQHMKALGRANSIRLRRAALKRELGSLARGPAYERLAELVETADPDVSTVYVIDLFQWVFRVGKGTSQRACARLHVSEAKQVGSLTERQRRVLVKALRLTAEGMSLCEAALKVGPEMEFPTLEG